MSTTQFLHCSHCGWRSLAGYTEKIQWLRAHGHLLRAARPEPELVNELFGRVLHNMACPDCHRPGVDWETDEGWETVPTRDCARCGVSIPRERLEVFPDTEYCVKCQKGVETGTGRAGSHDFCPRCGNTMQVRQVGSRSRSQYQLHCTACGHRE